MSKYPIYRKKISELLFIKRTSKTSFAWIKLEQLDEKKTEFRNCLMVKGAHYDDYRADQIDLLLQNFRYCSAEEFEVWEQFLPQQHRNSSHD